MDETVHRNGSGASGASAGDLRLNQEKRNRATTLALVSTLFLTAFKFFVGILSGSVSVLSEAIHSLLDLVSAAVAFVTVRLAGKPADSDHPFGHGKFETLSALLEAGLLFGAAGFILHEALDQWSDPQEIRFGNVAIVTMLVSVVVSYFVYRHNKQAAEETESSAIHLNALHFLSDVIAGAGVLLGLILIQWTGWLRLDSIVAALVAVYICWISWVQVRRSFGELVDVQLPQREVDQIQGVLGKFQNRVIGIHDLRTRKSGSHRHIDFHLVMCGQMTVNDSHQICDEMEEALKRPFPLALISIHVEPCAHENLNCERVCDFSLIKGEPTRDSV